MELIFKSCGAEVGLISEAHSGFEAQGARHFMHIMNAPTFELHNLHNLK